MHEQPPKFTEWCPWSSRNIIDCIKGNGVYLLAHFDSNEVPKGPASPLEPQLIYIGETHRRSFQKRFSEFDRSARTGQKSHAGGVSYHERHLEVMNKLYVAVFCPSDTPSERKRSVYIRYIEAKLLWSYVTSHDPDNLCNKH